MTIGEIRVRVDFNVSGSDEVAAIKQKSAELINLVSNLPIKEDGEFARLRALAMTAYEEGAMWAVKAATIK